MTFAERLARAQQISGSLVCVGLDPDPAKLPKDLAEPDALRGAQAPFASAEPLYAFNRRIVDATAGIAAAYKPQIAFYSALGAEDQLVASIRYIRERAPAALSFWMPSATTSAIPPRLMLARRSIGTVPMR